MEMMVTFRVVKLVLDIVEQIADRVLPFGQGIQKRAKFFATHLLKIFNFALSNNGHSRIITFRTAACPMQSDNILPFCRLNI